MRLVEEVLYVRMLKKTNLDPPTTQATLNEPCLATASLVIDDEEEPIAHRKEPR